MTVATLLLHLYSFQGGFEQQDKKFDELYAKFDQQRKLLLQILDRLPPP